MNMNQRMFNALLWGSRKSRTPGPLPAVRYSRYFKIKCVELNNSQVRERVDGGFGQIHYVLMISENTWGKQPKQTVWSVSVQADSRSVFTSELLLKPLKSLVKYVMVKTEREEAMAERDTVSAQLKTERWDFRDGRTRMFWVDVSHWWSCYQTVIRKSVSSLGF